VVVEGAAGQHLKSKCQFAFHSVRRILYSWSFTNEVTRSLILIEQETDRGPAYQS
jgi:hypothetical protein